MFSKKLYIAAVFSTILLSACGTTRPAGLHDPIAELRKSINVLLADSLFVPSRVSIRIVSLRNGELLFDHESRALMHPASNLKLCTSAAALSILGTRYRLNTSVLVTTKPSRGTLDGDVYLKGYGDPDLTTADLDSLAAAVRRMGIRRITRNLVVDNSFFDDAYWGNGWMWDDDSDPDAPFISALSVNKNCVTAVVNIDSVNARKVLFSLTPQTDFVAARNRVTVSTDTIRSRLAFHRIVSANVNTITAEGKVLAQAKPISVQIALRGPEFYAGHLFRDALVHAGVQLMGEIESGVVPDGSVEIAGCSHSLDSVVVHMNKQSDNLSAENVLKVLSTQKYPLPGTSCGGTYVVKQFLASVGIDTTQLSIVDGSGVSRYNLLTSEQIVTLLAALCRQSRVFPVLYESLPIAGRDGTLATRMQFSPGAPNLRAKTGTLAGVSCLAGYAYTRDGEPLAFSIMMQNFLGPASSYREVQDRIASLLTGFSRKPVKSKKPSTQ